MSKSVESNGSPPNNDAPALTLARTSQRRLQPNAASHGCVLLFAVGLGGFFGGLSRYGLLLITPDQLGEFMWTTLAINVTGSFLLPVLVIGVVEVCQVPAWVRPAFGTGFLGAFTTFSAYAWEVSLNFGLPKYVTDEGPISPTPASGPSGWATLLLPVALGLGASLLGYFVAPRVTRWLCTNKTGTHSVPKKQLE